MALPTWIPDALRSERRPLERVFWRCVEAQHVVSTLQLVDTLEEQALLEDILEETKPPVPPDCRHLHYLYMTPFRYGLYPQGSRFRRAGQTSGVSYVSEAPRTAVIETAFHLLLFYAESPDTPFPARPSEHTAFDVPVSTEASVDLTAPPFAEAMALWSDPQVYEPCQQLADAARAQGVAAIRYASVRDRGCGVNAALLACSVFAADRPSRSQTWRLLFNGAGVHAICEFHGERFTLAPPVFADDPRLARLRWR